MSIRLVKSYSITGIKNTQLNHCCFNTEKPLLSVEIDVKLHEFPMVAVCLLSVNRGYLLVSLEAADMKEDEESKHTVK